MSSRRSPALRWMLHGTTWPPLHPPPEPPAPSVPPGTARISPAGYAPIYPDRPFSALRSTSCHASRRQATGATAVRRITPCSGTRPIQPAARPALSRCLAGAHLEADNHEHGGVAGGGGSSGSFPRERRRCRLGLVPPHRTQLAGSPRPHVHLFHLPIAVAALQLPRAALRRPQQTRKGRPRAEPYLLQRAPPSRAAPQLGLHMPGARPETGERTQEPSHHPHM